MSKAKKITIILSKIAKEKYDKIKNHDRYPYKKFSQILKEIKDEHKNDEYFKKLKDPEQSWKAILGSILEYLIEYAVEDKLSEIGLKCIKPTKKNLGKNYEIAKKQLSVKIGSREVTPDADRIVYLEKPFTVIAILTIKKKFRERIAQIAYWTIQLRKSSKNIKNILITTDENGTFTAKVNKRMGEKKIKAKAIAEIDINGTFVASEAQIEESGKIKDFDKLIDELKKLNL